MAPTLALAATGTGNLASVPRYHPYPDYKDTDIDWLNQIPSHWRVMRLKRVCMFEYGDSLPSENRTYGDVLVYGSNGAVGTHECANALGPCLVIDRKGSFGRVNYCPTGVFAIDTTFYVDRRGTDADICWLYYLLSHIRLDAVSRDSAIPGLDREDAYARRVVFCDSNEQRAIAGFLDRETAKIDALVAKKERLIELLNEKRNALITRAVTKGIDHSIRMKDSGVEWMGKIPTHWDVKRINQISKILRGKFTHRPRNDPSLYDGPWPFIQTGDVTRALKEIKGYRQTLNERGFRASKMFPAGTLVMTIAANIGDVAVLNFAACFPDSIVGFVPRHGIERDYLFSLFSAIKPELLRDAPVNTQGNLNIERIGSSSPIPIPPKEEQRAIATYLDRETRKIEDLVAKVQEAIDRLKELRTALISAAVIGKIDVREPAP